MDVGLVPEAVIDLALIGAASTAPTRVACGGEPALRNDSGRTGRGWSVKRSGGALEKRRTSAVTCSLASSVRSTVMA